MVLLNTKHIKFYLKKLFTDRMRPLDCLSSDVSLYESISCNPAVLGETSEEPCPLWVSSAVHQTTATQQQINLCEDTCDYFNPKAVIISLMFSLFKLGLNFLFFNLALGKRVQCLFFLLH